MHRKKYILKATENAMHIVLKWNPSWKIKHNANFFSLVLNFMDNELMTAC